MNDPRPKWVLSLLAAVRSSLWRRLAIGAGTFTGIEAFMAALQIFLGIEPTADGLRVMPAYEWMLAEH